MHVYLNGDVLDEIQMDYATCLVTNYQTRFDAEEKIKMIENGDILNKLADVCLIDPENKFPSLIALTGCDYINDIGHFFWFDVQLQPKEVKELE